MEILDKTDTLKCIISSAFYSVSPIILELSFLKSDEVDETVPYREIVKVLNIANENKFKMVLATRPPEN